MPAFVNDLVALARGTICSLSHIVWRLFPRRIVAAAVRAAVLLDAIAGHGRKRRTAYWMQ
jgi:hypothetical protein